MVFLFEYVGHTQSQRLCGGYILCGDQSQCRPSRLIKFSFISVISDQTVTGESIAKVLTDIIIVV